jgi:hypothetical protein
MLPALAEIVSNVVGLQLAPDTTAAVLGAVLAPLLRSDPDVDPASEDPTKIRRKRAGRPRLKLRGAVHRRRKRDRALSAIRDNPDATVARIAKLAKCCPSTAVNARKDLAAEARRQARKAARDTAEPAKLPSERRQRAQRFLKDALAQGPKPASAVEEAAAKAHIGGTALDQARAELGIVASRANAGGVQAVQWSLPG